MLPKKEKILVDESGMKGSYKFAMLIIKSRQVTVVLLNSEIFSLTVIHGLCSS